MLIRNRDHLLIENVAVDPSRQHQGIGRALLAVAETHALSLATRILRLYTNTAMSENLELYPHLGHKETARRTEDGFERVFFTSSSQKSTPGLPTRGPLVYRVMRQRWTSCPVPEQ